MTPGYVKWSDVRAEHVERAGGEAAVAERVRALLAEAETPDTSRSTPDTTPRSR